jgi:hypothetical protein
MMGGYGDHYTGTQLVGLQLRWQGCHRERLPESFSAFPQRDISRSGISKGFGIRYSFDIVELGGRLRDKLFHGVPFLPDHLTENVRAAFSLLENAPLYVADTLTEYCKVALYGEVIGAESSEAG